MRIFKTKGVKRFTRREQITDANLTEAVVRQALSDGDLQEIEHDD